MFEYTDVTSAARLAVTARFPSGNIMKELISLMGLSDKTRDQKIRNKLKQEFLRLKN